MAIQGTQNTQFLYFSNFSNLFFIFMKNKIKQNWKQTNKNMLTKQSIKLDRLKTRKQNTQVMHIKKKDREKWLNHLEPFSFHALEEPFCLVNLSV